MPYYPPTGVGKTVQIVNVQTGAVATGTTTIPVDDTIPQQSGPGEGTEFMTLAITPTNASSTLKIEVVAHVSTAATSRWNVVALFQDATAGAINVGATYYTLSGAGAPTVLTHYMTAGTTSATTFRVRGGPDQAGTMTFNGAAGGRLFGGVYMSSITITEYLP